MKRALLAIILLVLILVAPAVVVFISAIVFSFLLPHRYYHEFIVSGVLIDVLSGSSLVLGIKASAVYSIVGIALYFLIGFIKSRTVVS